MSEEKQIQPILLTTAISYPNNKPHIGHLYESLLADFLKAAYQKIYFGQVYLLTGTDEHGKKIEITAKQLDINEQKLCDINSSLFKNMNDDIQTRYDCFIRTTDEDHIDNVKTQLDVSFNKQDIYKTVYKGWYNIREERFITETEAKTTEYKDITGQIYDLVEEDTYNFKLSKYINDINYKIVYPSVYGSDNRVNDKLNDISISRTSVKWGIPLPFDTSHTTYVWFDALLNYISGSKKICKDVTPKMIHIIGKDIVWFHSVIYQAILHSCNLLDYLPQRIIVHGFITDDKGRKMSKSLGNVIDIDYLLKKYPLDAVRNYMILETSLDNDLIFSEKRLVECYNNELVKSYGNLFQRFCSMILPIQQEFNHSLKNIEQQFLKDIYDCKQFISDFTDELNISKFKKKLYSYVSESNTIITNQKPWALQPDQKIEILAYVYINILCASFMLSCIIPEKINNLFDYLGIKCDGQLYPINITSNSKIIAFNEIK